MYMRSIRRGILPQTPTYTPPDINIPYPTPPSTLSDMSLVCLPTPLGQGLQPDQCWWLADVIPGISKGGRLGAMGAIIRVVPQSWLPHPELPIVEGESSHRDRVVCSPWCTAYIHQHSRGIHVHIKASMRYVVTRYLRGVLLSSSRATDNVPRSRGGVVTSHQPLCWGE